MTRRVRILPADTTIEVAHGEAVLAAALRAGFAFPYSCRNGACGACLGRLVEGEIEYPAGRPPALTARDEAEHRAVFCQAHPLTDLVIEAHEITQTRSQVVRTLPARVERIEQLAADVKRLLLRLPPNEHMEFLPGQYIDIILRDGRRRSFSLANRPQPDALLELHVRLAPGGRFTSYVFDGLRERDLLRIEGPLGVFFLRESERPALLIAGGTGFAPIKSIVETVAASPRKREMHLFWGVRTHADLYLEQLAQQWEASGLLSYTPVLSHPDDNGWSGETGWVHEVALRQFPELADFQVYMSGPPAMIAAAREDLAAAGLAPEHLFFDAFDYAHDELPARG